MMQFARLELECDILVRVGDHSRWGLTWEGSEDEGERHDSGCSAKLPLCACAAPFPGSQQKHTFLLSVICRAGHKGAQKASNCCVIRVHQG